MSHTLLNSERHEKLYVDEKESRGPKKEIDKKKQKSKSPEKEESKFEEFKLKMVQASNNLMDAATECEELDHHLGRKYVKLECEKELAVYRADFESTLKDETENCVAFSLFKKDMHKLGYCAQELIMVADFVSNEENVTGDDENQSGEKFSWKLKEVLDPFCNMAMDSEAGAMEEVGWDRAAALLFMVFSQFETNKEIDDALDNLKKDTDDSSAAISLLLTKLAPQVSVLDKILEKFPTKSGEQ